MEIILLKDVDHLGHEGDTVTVADGYAHNFLLPKRLAEKSSAANLRALEQRRRAIERREGEKRGAARGLVDRLTSTGIVLEAAVGEGGRLHGQITSQQIVEAMLEQTGIKIDRRHVEIHSPIRGLGEFTVSAQVYKDVRCDVSVHVVTADGEAEAPEEEAMPEPVAAAAPVEAPAPEPVEAVEEPEAAEEPEPAEIVEEIAESEPEEAAESE